jgi:hypothetical protein
MKNTIIQKADKLGLCFGVARALKLLKEAADKYGEIETLGPVAHNRLLVETLADLGVKPADHLGQAQAKVLAITTHGTSPAVLAEIRVGRRQRYSCPQHKANRQDGKIIITPRRHLADNTDPVRLLQICETICGSDGAAN